MRLESGAERASHVQSQSMRLSTSPSCPARTGQLREVEPV